MKRDEAFSDLVSKLVNHVVKDIVIETSIMPESLNILISCDVNKGSSETVVEICAGVSDE